MCEKLYLFSSPAKAVSPAKYTGFSVVFSASDKRSYSFQYGGTTVLVVGEVEDGWGTLEVVHANPDCSELLSELRMISWNEEATPGSYLFSHIPPDAYERYRTCTRVIRSLLRYGYCYSGKTEGIELPPERYTVRLHDTIHYRGKPEQLQNLMDSCWKWLYVDHPCFLRTCPVVDRLRYVLTGIHRLLRKK